MLAAAGLRAEPLAGLGATNVLDRYTFRASVPELPGADGYQSNFSGCCAHPGSGEIVAVMRGPTINDYALQFYTPNGEWTRFVTLTGFDDLEAVCVVDPASNLFAVAEERLNAITILTIDDAATTVSKSSGRTIAMGLGDLLNAGIEGLTYDAARRCFYAVKEYQPEGIYRITDNGSNVVTELFPADRVSTLCEDLSDVFYDATSDHLFILSDISQLIVECTLDGTVVGTRATSLSQAEGVTLSTARDELFVIGEPRQFERFTAHWLEVPEGDTRALALRLSEATAPAVTAAVTVVAEPGAVAQVDYTPPDATARFTNGLAASVTVRAAPDDTLNPPRELRLSLANPLETGLGDDTVAVWRVIDPGRFACTLDTLPGVGAPFRLTVAAEDTNALRLTGFEGPVSLRLHGAPPAPRTMLDATETQSAALSERSTRGLQFAVSNDIVVTHLLFAFGTRTGLWRDDGTLLASVASSLSNGVWQAVALSSPVTLTTGHLYRVAASRSINLQQFSTVPLAMPAPFADGTILSGCLTNAANTFPGALSDSTFAVDIRYSHASGISRTLLPSSSGAFRGGTWAGWLTVPDNVLAAEIEAYDENGHTGRSAPVDVIARPAVTLTVPSLAMEGAGTLAGAGSISIAPLADALEVALVSEDTNAILLPASVVVPAAATSAVFDVTVVDNAALGDTRTAFLYATATNHTAGTNSITVWNDDRPAGLLLHISKHP